MNRRIVSAIVHQHIEELAILWNTRLGLVAAGSVALRHIARIDERIAAHQDGCVVAGDEGLGLLMEQMIAPTRATMFAATLVALDIRDGTRTERCLSIAESAADALRGVRAAFGWVERDRLSGVVQSLLTATSPFHRRMGLAACRLQTTDPGAPLVTALRSDRALVRAEGLRAAGTLGRRQLVSTLAATRDEDQECRLWAAWSAVILGDRESALEALTDAALTSGPRRTRAFILAFQAMPLAGAHRLLQSLAGRSNDFQWLVQGAGIVGDPTYVPWLIGHMSNDQTARLAGEAFSLITGTDLALLDLERKPPENFESGPNDDPDDPNVDMDPDDGLPWPDPEKVKAWWDKNSHGFQSGTRYFMGQPVTREHCIEVLKNGYQRQRILAAHYLCLLNPGTPLFNTSAPAWRQQRLLAEMR